MRMPPFPRLFWVLGLTAVGLVFLPGCSRPQVDPWPNQLRGAAQARTAALSGADRAD